MLSLLLLGLNACSSGGSTGGTTPVPPAGSAPIIVTSGSSFLSSPVKIVFSVTNFVIGLPGTPHLRFSIDGGALHDFYNGTGINSDNGVLLNGVHNHAIHWTSTTSFDLFGLAAGLHQVRLVLVDGSDAELPGTSVTHSFRVNQPPTGELQLELVLGGLDLPSALQQAPDGRIFLNERITGNIRVVNQAGSTWQLNPTPFCTVPVEQNGEGLLGLALDPAFSSNEAVYVFYSSASGNRVSMLTRSGVSCVETPILEGLPTASIHNGGIIKFGPDGKLYVVIGDAENPDDAQTLTSLAGKVLRVNSDGSAPSNNPFFTNANANAKKIFSLGHRNSFGLTFHPQTGDLWETENGQDDFDEVNRVIAGRNYGWDSSLRSGFLNKPCCVNPIVALPIIAPTGIIAVPAASAIYPPAYHNNLLVAAYIDGSIRLVVPNSLNPSGPGTTSVAYPGGEGGLVGMMLGNDGYVYVSNHDFNVQNGSSIFRVIPH
ncbi:MAG: PQQ-dependent sugar dehydrogenase [Nitrospira sp.]|nr:PQQ-dependent sugar dehydrogenase [Nitrospira sp.]